MSTLATLTNVGRAAIAKAICAREIAIGWGSGQASWDSMAESALPNLLERTALYAPVGYRKTAAKGYCTPSSNGDIIVPIGQLPDGTVDVTRYAASSTPTPYLYFRANYDFGDASTATIREIGLFMDTVYKSGLPAGQQYYTTAQVQTPGELLSMQILKPVILRSASIRQMIEFVLPI